MDKLELYEVIAGIDGEIVDSALEAERAQKRKRAVKRTRITTVALIASAFLVVAAAATAIYVNAKNRKVIQVIECTPGPDGNAEVIIREHYMPIDVNDPETWGEDSEFKLIYDRANDVLKTSPIDMYIVLTTYPETGLQFGSYHHTLSFVQRGTNYTLSALTDEIDITPETPFANGQMLRFNIQDEDNDIVFNVLKEGKVIGSISVTVVKGTGPSEQTYLIIGDVRAEGLVTKNVEWDYENRFFF